MNSKVSQDLVIPPRAVLEHMVSKTAAAAADV